MTTIPPGWPATGEYWHGRWLAAMAMLDRAGFDAIVAHRRIARLEAERRGHRSPWVPDAQDGLPPWTYPSWRKQEMERWEGQ